MTTRTRPLFAVLYDAGAVPAGEIGTGLAPLGDIAFLLPEGSAHVEQMRPVIEQLGRTHPLTSDPSADAELIRVIRPDAVLTFSERLIRPAAELAAAVGLPGQSVRTARIFTDKGLQRRVLREAGVDRTRTGVVKVLDDWPATLDEVGLPAIVKPATGWSSQDTYAISSQEEAAEVLEHLTELHAAGSWRPFVIEEFLRGQPSHPFGDYVSVESICTPAGISHFVLTGKTPVVPPFRGTGRVWPSHLPLAQEQEILDLVTRALEAVGSDCGFTHTEVKITPDGPGIIEINGRISAHVNMMAREACGMDLVRVGGLMALGEQPYLPPFDFGGKVHYQYNNIAPVRPGRLEAVHGADTVREMPGITTYRNFVRPGDELPGGSTTLTLDSISGVAESHGAMVRTIEEARAALTFEFRFSDGVHRIGGLELPEH
ncbi:ATP-grasp domain-containing protein [Streptomyces sp. RPA4-5]|uniref:ATP-grasp domain-containing protein n=1 Tax=Streptomyces sp. RPA4-5 TaxID=2721245 RepID=UPI00143EE348|nr:ATP-grasp domain-containing protein [Streptomyces sp. RPA4-5]QIY59010.1 ATP-grasp domain-containing protein [Streptomyces sp. RPA4-5]